MSQLSVCPLCRSVLAEPLGRTGGSTPVECPGCGGDLSQFLELEEKKEHYLNLALEYAKRGEVLHARRILDGLAHFTGYEDSEQAIEIEIELEIAKGGFDQALKLAGQLPTERAGQYSQRAHRGIYNQHVSRELYNLALNSVRNGMFVSAADSLAEAAKADPRNASVWLLKLKTDLKCGYFSSCYEDLAALDGLSARPPEFRHLESILPPMSVA